MHTESRRMAPIPKGEIQNEQNGNAVKTGQQSSGCFGGAAAVAGGKIEIRHKVWFLFGIMYDSETTVPACSACSASSALIQRAGQTWCHRCCLKKTVANTKKDVLTSHSGDNILNQCFNVYFPLERGEYQHMLLEVSALIIVKHLFFFFFYALFSSRKVFWMLQHENGSGNLLNILLNQLQFLLIACFSVHLFGFEPFKRNLHWIN